MQSSEIEIFEKKYGNEPVQVFSRIRIPYKWHVGKVASQFFQKLRDEKSVYGLRCEPCQKTLVPPRETCPYCFGKPSQWRKIENTAVIESFTSRGSRVAGLVRFKEASTAMLHFILEEEPNLFIGAEVEAVFKAAGTGSILDIEGFKLKRGQT